MRSCDVLIVGGGPAGSACAWKLRREGIDAAVLDKSAFPRDKICGGWITPRVLSILEIDASEYAKKRVLQPIRGFRTSAMGGADCETRYGETVSYGIRRCEFDHFLVERSGARLFEGEALQSLERRGGRWLANESIEARVVVGAGGHFCPVPRLVGAKTAAETAVVAQEVEFEMSAEQIANCAVERETPELYFCPDLKGYGWCFRKGDVLNIGLGRADPHRLSAHVSAFLKFLRARVQFDIPAPRGHAYLLYGSSPRRRCGIGWLLIGDAAGLAYPFSGEGILPAIESGLLAAEAIAAGKMAGYPGMLDARFRREASLIERVGANVSAGLLMRVAPRLLRWKPFAKSVVLDRWFLRT